MRKHTLFLQTGGVLEIHEGFVRYVDENGREGHLTPAQQSILGMLAEAEGSPVPYGKLYEKYTGTPAEGSANQYLSKIRNRIKYPEVKACICAVEGVGYRLDTSKLRPMMHDAVHQMDAKNGDDGLWVRKLAGDYYGFYLDAVGDGAVLGIYLHLEEQDGEMTANAVLGIQSDEVLRNGKLQAVFMDPQKRYWQNYQTVIQDFSDNDQRCFFAEGKVIAHQSIAIITMKTSLNAVWTILMDADGFLEIDQMRRDTNHPYRGGMGIIMALAGSHGQFCARCGLIRRACMKPTIVLDNPRLREFLKIFGDEEGIEGKGQPMSSCDPLNMARDRDNKWYNWFMKGARADTNP